ncbi:MAG: MMPL family transporter [Nitrospirae bacterium]|nr:MMPL family transporter [Nitrospirota bacterium]
MFINLSLKYPRTVILLTIIITIFLSLQFPKIKIDTDPENMLAKDEPIRVFHNQVKKEFGINEMIVLGILREDGIFHRDTLKKIKEITDSIKHIKGVIADDILSLSVTNNVIASGGTLRVRPPLYKVPDTNVEVESLKKEILDNPLFKDRLVSSDGKGAAIYIPIESKDIAHEVAQEIRKILEPLKGKEKFYMAGLPLAEDTFGAEMFKQMAIVAPLAGGFLMLILLIIFRRIMLVLPAMIVAMLSVMWTMGAMIGLGFTVHIMSSMIPVFLMPIAVCDSVHVLSDFYEHYKGKDRVGVIRNVFRSLFRPMFYTSLTTAVGFANLAWAKIPPVRVFGLFVAFGVLAAWLLSVTFLPAFLSILKEKRLKGLEQVKSRSRVLSVLSDISISKSRVVVIVGALLFVVAIYGVTTLRVNDNPVKWFKKSHPIRVADTVLNRIIGGTYISYLIFEGSAPEDIKRPEVVKYMDDLQRYLHSHHLVGKTTSIADVVKRINYVLHNQDASYERVPESKQLIGQYLFLFLMSSKPDELDNLVDYDYKKANLWVQLRSGDNRDMTEVVRSVENYVKENPLPKGISIKWSGLPYLNIVWQKLMVSGMLKATIGSYWVVFILLIVLFRSFWWAVIAILPLSFSIIFSYGLIGFAGKDYDMPIAVCSTLTLGLGIDFAIHFCQRFRAHYKETGNLNETMQWVTKGEPTVAIARNAIVVGLGFLPLVLATLTPYVTVGLFFGSLALFAGITTIFFLPALIETFKGKLIKGGY